MSKTYKWNPELYKNSSSEQMRWALELLSKLNLKGDEHLLDIGCGDGKVTAKIAEMLPNGSVVGIDNSQEMIEYASKMFPETNHANLKFQVMSADTIQFQNKFDCVFSNATLHWVKDQNAVWKGISQCLKPGGNALIQMGGKGNAQLAINLLNEIIQQEKWKKYFDNFDFHYNFFSTEEYKKFIISSGLKARRIELIEKDMLHNGKEGIKAWIYSVWLPYTEKIPEEFRNEFVDLLSEQYVKINPCDDNGIVHTKMIRLEAESYKQ